MRAGPEREHFQTYTGRIKSWPVTVREIDPRRPARDADKRREWLRANGLGEYAGTVSPWGYGGTHRAPDAPESANARR